MRRSSLAVILAPLVLACGPPFEAGGSSAGSGSGGADAGGSGTGGRPTCPALEGSGGGAGDIPSPGPGSAVDTAFAYVEPNITPQEATPLGTSLNPRGDGSVIPWVPQNAIGGAANPANYFVFRTSPEAGELKFDMCYQTPVTSLTASLWKVVDAKQQKAPLATWSIPTSCEDSFSAPLEACTVYLFGLLATGGAGSYQA
jgi:hypothetical protein